MKVTVSEFNQRQKTRIRFFVLYKLILNLVQPGLFCQNNRLLAKKAKNNKYLLVCYFKSPFRYSSSWSIMNFSRKALYKEACRRKITSFSGTCHSMCIGMQWHFRVDSANYWFSIIELDCHSLKVCKNLLSSYYFKSRPKILIELLVYKV